MSTCVIHVEEDRKAHPWRQWMTGFCYNMLFHGPFSCHKCLQIADACKSHTIKRKIRDILVLYKYLFVVFFSWFIFGQTKSDPSLAHMVSTSWNQSQNRLSDISSFKLFFSFWCFAYVFLFLWFLVWSIFYHCYIHACVHVFFIILVLNFKL